MRLDAIARVVQDVADADASTARRVGNGHVVLATASHSRSRTRRAFVPTSTRARGAAASDHGGPNANATACRRGLCVEATAIWVHVDPEPARRSRSRPLRRRLGRGRGQRARSRPGLTHAPAADDARAAVAAPATDLDVLGHVNNAAYWAPVEEELARRAADACTGARSSSGPGSTPATMSNSCLAEQPTTVRLLVLRRRRRPRVDARRLRS